MHHICIQLTSNVKYLPTRDARLLYMPVYIVSYTSLALPQSGKDDNVLNNIGSDSLASSVILRPSLSTFLMIALFGDEKMYRNRISSHYCWCIATNITVIIEERSNRDGNYTNVLCSHFCCPWRKFKALFIKSRAKSGINIEQRLDLVGIAC